MVSYISTDCPDFWRINRQQQKLKPILKHTWNIPLQRRIRLGNLSYFLKLKWRSLLGGGIPRKKMASFFTHGCWWLNHRFQKHISQIGSFLQVGVNIKNKKKHHLAHILVKCGFPPCPSSCCRKRMITCNHPESQFIPAVDGRNRAPVDR